MDVTTIGVDLGGQSVKLAVVDACGVIRVRRQAGVDAGWDAGRVVELICDEVGQLLREAVGGGRESGGGVVKASRPVLGPVDVGLAANDSELTLGEAGLSPRAIGMVMPGYMDRSCSRLIFAANLPTLSGTTFLADLRAALPLPVVFDADSNGAALAEARFGAGRDVGRLIVATVGTGIGGGVVVDGQILRIREHIAGSLGHVIVDARGARCRCGARGCVETLAAGPALERRAGELADGDSRSRLAELRAERGRLTGVEIAAALEQGDSAARQAVAECGWWLGAGVASWSVIYAPELVLIAGGIAMLGQPLLEAVRTGFNEVGQPCLTKKVRIEAAQLGADAGVIGAAAMAGFGAGKD